MTYRLSVVGRKRGVNDMHPGALVSKISTLWLPSITGPEQDWSLRGLIELRCTLLFAVKPQLEVYFAFL